jgi:glycerate 2-kinase
MKIILAPDSFKGTFTAPQVCRAFEQGVLRVYPQAGLAHLPLADGGEGTLEVLLAAVGGDSILCPSRDPLGRPIQAGFGLLAGGEALIEMARSSGLALLAESERNPWLAGTFGLGMLVRAALDRGASALALTLGGSATVDGGVGMARALGFRFLDRLGREIGREGGRVLNEIARIDPDGAEPRLAGLPVRALSDVRNPLLGPDGASRVFGPQKGADPAMVERLERGLANLARRIELDLGRKVAELPGSGAAGGLGAAVPAFLGGRLIPGIDYILDTLGFDRALEGAALVLTGEGSFDSQSLGGKVISGVLKRAAARRVPVTVICGRAKKIKSGEADPESGVSALRQVLSGSDLPGGGSGERLVTLEDLALLAARAVETVEL